MKNKKNKKKINDANIKILKLLFSFIILLIILIPVKNLKDNYNKMEKTLFIINQNMLKFINLSRFCFLSNEYFFIILYIFNKF